MKPLVFHPDAEDEARVVAATILQSALNSVCVSADFLGPFSPYRK
jgi:hypothetical protein